MGTAKTDAIKLSLGDVDNGISSGFGRSVFANDDKALFCDGERGGMLLSGGSKMVLVAVNLDHVTHVCATYTHEG